MPSEQLPDVWLNTNPKYYGTGMFSTLCYPVPEGYYRYIPFARHQTTLAELHAEREAHTATKARLARLLELANAMVDGESATEEHAKAVEAFRAEFPNTNGGE